MDAPLIGILAYRLAAGRVRLWPWGGFAVPEGYVQAVLRAGGIPALIPPTAMEVATPDTIVERFDGLLLCGGGDVEPRRYGEDPSERLYGVDGVRDEFELGMITAACDADVPTLAVCRGMQVLNVAYGGTLHQHLPDVEGTGRHGIPPADEAVLHEVGVEPTSLLRSVTDSRSVKGLAHHHQGVDRLGDGLVATARTDDGLIEAVERPGWWMVAVQWHPEETAAEDPQQQALFDALVGEARRRRAADAHASRAVRPGAPSAP
jgi:gamma-glutamyl-gamma-aminobutyrate hydrolase PuuD